jgi:hypothetical protein
MPERGPSGTEHDTAHTGFGDCGCYECCGGAAMDDVSPDPPVAATGPDSEPQNVTGGMPPELVRALRDPAIRLPQDDNVLADGRSLWEHLEEWRNAPSDTASGDPGPASVSPADPPRRKITVTHTHSATFVQAEVDAVWNSGVLPIPNAEYVRADDPDARAMAVFEALDGSLLELFYDQSDDDTGYEVEDYDPEA